jgi:hypothetical protein
VKGENITCQILMKMCETYFSETNYTLDCLDFNSCILQVKICRISGSHYSKCEDYCLLDCTAT